MRTTIDLPDDLHRQLKAIARDTSRTLSQTAVELMRRGLERDAAGEICIDERTGLPLVTVGRVITSVDARAPCDEM